GKSHSKIPKKYRDAYLYNGNDRCKRPCELMIENEPLEALPVGILKYMVWEVNTHTKNQICPDIQKPPASIDFQGASKV
ncbi:MAG: hypothetical protein AAGF66_21295, partial [Cyanobacteria bacterium P01_H01_bin.119]